MKGSCAFWSYDSNAKRKKNIVYKRKINGFYKDLQQEYERFYQKKKNISKRKVWVKKPNIETTNRFYLSIPIVLSLLDTAEKQQ